MRTKRIPLDLARINEENIKVVTRDGRSARIICASLKGAQNRIAAAVDNGSGENVFTYYSNGRFYESGESGADLMLEIPVKSRRMTYRELAWWLKDHPEEHREVRCGDWENNVIAGYYSYTAHKENSEVLDGINIRSNGGEWHEPLICEE